MVSKAKRKARAEAAAAEEAAADGGGPSSSEDSSDSEGEAAAVRPSKRIKGAAGGGAAAAAPGGAAAAAGGWRNKEKPLVLCSRGIPGRFRHLMLDIVQLLPHCKKDVKLDTKDERYIINEVADLQGCTSAVFFEARKRTDLFLWLAKTPAGPSVKFHVTNVHTMEELKLAGNHLKGSRPALHFDASFGESGHSALIKELLLQVFSTPRGHRKSKPFCDHVLGFYWLQGRVWLRNYQASWPAGRDGAAGRLGAAGAEPPQLLEVGPRMVLHPIRVFAGAFRGAVLWSNPDYVSPNAVRRHARAQAGGAYQRKVKAKQRRKEHTAKWASQPGELDNERVFK